MKKLLIAMLIFVVLIVLAAIGVFLYLDSAAKAAVEKGGTYAMGVNTTLKSADVKPFAGQFAMDGLNVANPDGFDSKHFMTLGTGDVALSLGSLMDATIRLPLLKLSDSDMNLEKKDGKANYQTILDNLKKLSPEKPDPNAKKYVIETVEIRDVNVHVNMLGDLTKGLGDLANLDKLGEIADIGGGIAGKAGEAAQQAADEAKKKAEELANKAKEGLGGILGGDKPKPDGK